MNMRKLSLISLFTVAAVLALAVPATSAAQQPKLDIKVFLGVGGTTYVAMLETAKIIVQREGQPSLRLKPKADNLAIYQAIARFGTSVDLAMFNAHTTSSCASFSKCASRVHNRAPCAHTLARDSHG
jgi:hypothetical protein